MVLLSLWCRYFALDGEGDAIGAWHTQTGGVTSYLYDDHVGELKKSPLRGTDLSSVACLQTRNFPSAN